MTPRTGNETARSVQLIGVGLSEVLIGPGQGVVSVPWPGKEAAGSSPDRDLAFISLTMSIVARCAVDEPVDDGVLLRDQTGDQGCGKDNSVGDSVAGLESETGEETAKIR